MSKVKITDKMRTVLETHGKPVILVDGREGYLLMVGSRKQFLKKHIDFTLFVSVDCQIEVITHLDIAAKKRHIKKFTKFIASLAEDGLLEPASEEPFAELANVAPLRFDRSKAKVVDF